MAKPHLPSEFPTPSKILYIYYSINRFIILQNIFAKHITHKFYRPTVKKSRNLLQLQPILIHYNVPYKEIPKTHTIFARLLTKSFTSHKFQASLSNILQILSYVQKEYLYILISLELF